MVLNRKPTMHWRCFLDNFLAKLCNNIYVLFKVIYFLRLEETSFKWDWCTELSPHHVGGDNHTNVKIKVQLHSAITLTGWDKTPQAWKSWCIFIAFFIVNWWKDTTYLWYIFGLISFISWAYWYHYYDYLLSITSFRPVQSLPIYGLELNE